MVLTWTDEIKFHSDSNYGEKLKPKLTPTKSKDTPTKQENLTPV